MQTKEMHNSTIFLPLLSLLNISKLQSNTTTAGKNPSILITLPAFKLVLPPEFYSSTTLGETKAKNSEATIRPGTKFPNASPSDRKENVFVP